MNYSELITQIEALNPGDVQAYTTNGLHSLQDTQQEFLNILSSKKIDNEMQLKSYIIDNSEFIISIFTLIKNIKDEFSQSMRSFDTMSNQMGIGRKKYIEPYEKLKKSISNKSNIDNVIILYEMIKSFQTEIKIIKAYYDSDTLTLSDNNFDIYIKGKQYPTQKLGNITYIKQDLDWFTRHDDDILTKFRNKFYISLSNRDNITILKFFDFYSKLSLLVTEIKTYSNKILKELMVETFLNKIIRGIINQISSLDMYYDNIQKIQKEISEFFITGDTYSSVFSNGGDGLKTSYDKKKFVLYEDIMQVEDLQDINALFMDKIFSSMQQIFEKIKKNGKFTNSYNYFIKDFIFFYFTVKRFYTVSYSSTNRQAAKKIFDDSIKEVKEDYMGKYKNSINENFTRAYTGVKNIERNADINGMFEKENIVNIHIIEHGVDYIKKMSVSFTELTNEFYIESDINFYSPFDECIQELQQTFSKEIISNYFDMIFNKLDTVLQEGENNTNITDKTGVGHIQKFYYFYYIGYKMNDVFLSFLNSNVNFLISNSLYLTLSSKMMHYMNKYYTIFIQKSSIKMLLLNRDDYTYYINYTNDLLKQTNTFFNKEHYNKNRAYEKPVMNFIIYIYLLSSVLLGFMNSEIDFEIYDNLLNNGTEASCLFFRGNSVDSIIKFHELVKMLSQVKSSDNIESLVTGKESEVKMGLYNIRKFVIDEGRMIKTGSEKNMSMELLARGGTGILIRKFKICGEGFDDGDEKVRNIIGEAVRSG